MKKNRPFGMAPANENGEPRIPSVAEALERMDNDPLQVAEQFRGMAVDLLGTIAQFEEAYNRQAAQAIELQQRISYLEQKNQKLEEQVVFDEMTGCYEKAYAHDVILGTINQALHANQIAGLLYLDIDHFTTINARYGHHGGDEVLNAFGRALFGNPSHKNLRFQQPLIRNGTDNAIRVGGDEFVIVFSSPSIAIAEEMAIRLMQGITERTEVPLNSDGQTPFKITASAGLTVISSKTVAVDYALALGDYGSRLAKRADMGRDACIFIPEGSQLGETVGVRQIYKGNGPYLEITAERAETTRITPPATQSSAYRPARTVNYTRYPNRGR